MQHITFIHQRSMKVIFVFTDLSQTSTHTHTLHKQAECKTVSMTFFKVHPVTFVFGIVPDILHSGTFQFYTTTCCGSHHFDTDF